MSNSKIFLAGIIAILILIFFFYAQNDDDNIEIGLNSEKSIQEVKEIPFENISIEAKAAYVFDLTKNEIVFDLNSNSQLPLASITKVMTAIVAKEMLPEWQVVSVGQDAIMQEGDSGFLVSERWWKKDLSDVMLISSSNDAAFALASADSLDGFVSNMNRKTTDLGLDQTFFLNPTGLDLNESVAGSYGSAKDVASLIAYVFENHQDILNVTREKSLTFESRNFKNTNKLIEEMPGILASKTGFSDLAGGNLAVVADIGYQYPVVIVVLGASQDGRFDDVRTLYEETLKYLQWR